VIVPQIDYDHAAFLLVGVIIDDIRLHLAMNHGYRDRCWRSTTIRNLWSGHR